MRVAEEEPVHSRKGRKLPTWKAPKEPPPESTRAILRCKSREGLAHGTRSPFRVTCGLQMEAAHKATAEKDDLKLIWSSRPMHQHGNVLARILGMLVHRPRYVLNFCRCERSPSRKRYLHGRGVVFMSKREILNMAAITRRSTLGIASPISLIKILMSPHD